MIRRFFTAQSPENNGRAFFDEYLARFRIFRLKFHLSGRRPLRCDFPCSFFNAIIRLKLDNSRETITKQKYFSFLCSPKQRREKEL